MKKFVLAAAALSAGFVATPAMAANVTTGSLNVNATVLNSCTVVAVPLSFGVLTEVGKKDVDATTTLSVVCTPNAVFDVGLDDGANADAGQRRMKAGDDGGYLPYEIYTTAARSSRWGNTVKTDTVGGSGQLLGVATVLTAYGRIAANTAPVPSGTYTDTVTVTVNF